MPHILGCPVSEALLTSWSGLILCEAAPFFFDDDPGLPHDALILSREAFSENQFDLSLTDSYKLYRVSREAKSVVFLTPTEFDALSSITQQSLLAAQVEFRRGQVYPWKQVEHLLESREVQSRSITVSDETYLVPDTKIWQALTDEVRARWLIAFVARENTLECLSGTLADADWPPAYPSVRALAGTFAARSGPNCFSTTLAAVTHNPVTAETIANFWLHQGTFFDGLSRRGYILTDEVVTDPDLHDAVLVWADQNGIAQHACYVIGNGFVLNKNTQAWYTPRQLLRLDVLLDDWKNEPFTIRVYRRALSPPMSST